MYQIQSFWHSWFLSSLLCWQRNELAFIFVPCSSVFFICRCFRREKNQQVHKKLSNERHNEFVQLHGLVQLFLMTLFGQWIPPAGGKKKRAGGVGQNFTCSSYCLFPAVLVQFFHHFPTHRALWQGSSLNVMPRNIWSKAGLKYVPLSWIRSSGTLVYPCMNRHFCSLT